MTLIKYRHWVSTPNVEPPDLSVVVPTYNEEWRILPTIGAIATHVSSMGLTWELIVADDGSSDSTISLIEGLHMKNLRLLIAAKNGGKGSAVRRGIKAAEGRFILFADADQSTPIEQLHSLLDLVERGQADIAIGSRAIGGATVHSKGAARRLASWGLRSVVRTLYPIRIEDTQCGFKLFSAEAAHKLFDTQLVDGFSFDLEVLYLAHRLGYSVTEVPVEWIDAPGSTVDTGRVALRFLIDLLLVRANDLLGRYDRRGRRYDQLNARTNTRERETTWTSTVTEARLVSLSSEGDSMPTNAMSSASSSTD